MYAPAALPFFFHSLWMLLDKEAASRGAWLMLQSIGQDT